MEHQFAPNKGECDELFILNQTSDLVVKICN